MQLAPFALRRCYWLAAGLFFSGGIAGFAAASAVTLTLDIKDAGPPLPARFSGLSFEMADVLPRKDGSHFFSAKNTRLLATFRQLGIRSLRVGGNTADRPAVAVPAPADFDELFAFARAAGVKVILTLRLREGDPADAARVAR